VFFPWWSKPTGDARVLPEHIQPVSAEVEGTVRKVLVHEGERVTKGQLLAEIAADEQRMALEQAQAQYDIQSRRVLQLEGEGKLGEARIERARMQEAAAKLGLERTQLTQTQLRAPISGVVVTPRLEERVGQYLKRGDVFCQVVDLTSAWAEVSLPEGDIGEVAAGEVAWLKLNTYPTRKFVGKVIQVAPQAREQSDERYFDVIVEVPNPDMALRAGMMGRGKVLARRASVGYLLLRVPARWIWLKLWKLLP
jgi:RND family efflux transporter MFP subunit